MTLSLYTIHSCLKKGVRALTLPGWQSTLPSSRVRHLALRLLPLTDAMLGKKPEQSTALTRARLPLYRLESRESEKEESECVDEVLPRKVCRCGP